MIGKDFVFRCVDAGCIEIVAAEDVEDIDEDGAAARWGRRVESITVAEGNRNGICDFCPERK